MKFDNVYFITGTAYAGKSTMVKLLAKKHNGIACEENYHDALLPELDKEEFPCLTYTRDLEDWHDFIRRTPEEYAAWVEGVTKECEKIELKILEEMILDPQNKDKKIFVDTNICLETLGKITNHENVLIMLADPMISVTRFFDRPDAEKQFLYQLMLEEKNPEAARENFRKCLEKINSPEVYDTFKNSGFNVILRDEKRTIEGTLNLVEKAMKLA